MSARAFPLAAAALGGAGALLVYLGICAAAYARARKGRRGSREAEDGWLFSGLSARLYDALFGDRDPEAVAARLGMDIEEHFRNCELAGMETDAVKTAMRRVYAIAALAASLVFALLTGVYAALFAGLALFCLLMTRERAAAESKARAKRDQIAEDLPRFLDLLQTELESGMAAEAAIKALCDHMDTLFAREMKAAFNSVEFGAGDWKEMLGKVADKYGVDTLNSFALTVSTAYEKGVSVKRAVEREVREVREAYMLDKKEKAGRMQNSILIPIIIFQLVPLMAFFLIPSIVSIASDW